MKKKKILFWAGLLAMLMGIAVLGVFGWKRISREIEKQRLLDTCVVLEIPDLNIKAPVMDGTEHEVLSKAAGHFPGTGDLGEGNYCIAGHNSTIYAEIFNEMKHIEIGMEMYLYDNDADRTQYTYIVTKNFIVEPSETWVLEDFGDDRLTIVTCTDDGTQRQIVVGELKK
ncbi:class D sortase [Ruminococcus callidus]|uniref:class D sortase n=1 Tax=Ruminococcus callidus TaxID=40519 RepID=UPI0023F12E1D|nr:class D sortase [Ruminococcus callidus]